MPPTAPADKSIVMNSLNSGSFPFPVINQSAIVIRI
nr:MAG TPA: hypothetical protein [Caudoviricetes sp.]